MAISSTLGVPLIPQGLPIVAGNNIPPSENTLQETTTLLDLLETGTGQPLLET